MSAFVDSISKDWAVSASPEIVEAWSQRRLTFPATDGLALFRTELRRAVAQLEAREDQQLDATYTSPVADRIDVENILLYNVGVGAFRSAGQHGLSLERVVGQVPPAPASLYAAGHYHRYAIASAAARWHAWRVAADIATIGPTPLPPLRGESKVSVVWYAVRRGPVERLATPGVGSSLGLELDLVSPARRASLVMFVKPLVDAVIAALHVHIDGLVDLALTNLVAAQVGATPEDVGRLLMSNDAAALGARRLIWPWRTGVQWNPADDRLVALRLRSVAGPAGAGWSLRGRASEVVPVG